MPSGNNHSERILLGHSGSTGGCLYNRRVMLTTREHMITPLFGVHTCVSNISELSMFK